MSSNTFFAAVIAMTTVSYRAIRSATANPGDSIRYEGRSLRSSLWDVPAAKSNAPQP